MNQRREGTRSYLAAPHNWGSTEPEVTTVTCPLASSHFENGICLRMLLITKTKKRKWSWEGAENGFLLQPPTSFSPNGILDFSRTGLFLYFPLNAWSSPDPLLFTDREGLPIHFLSCPLPSQAHAFLLLHLMKKKKLKKKKTCSWFSRLDATPKTPTLLFTFFFLGLGLSLHTEL